MKESLGESDIIRVEGLTNMDSRYIRIAIELIFLILVLGIPLYRFLKRIRMIKTVKDYPIFSKEEEEEIKKEGEENKELYDELLSKDWGYKFVEGDLDGYPDADLWFEFTRPLTSSEQKDLNKIFHDWYKKGFTKINKWGSEFGGFMHFMQDNFTFKEKYGFIGFDFGTVGIEKALINLLGTLSEWNKERIKKVVFGNDENIGNQIFPDKKLDE